MFLDNRNTRQSLVVAGSIVVLSLTAAGCSSAQNNTQTEQSTNKVSKPTASNDHTGSASSSQQSPTAVLQQYFQAIGAGHFDAAYALWRSQSNQAPDSAADLKTQYDGIASIHMKVTGDTHTEGAAGTVYATVPLAITEHTSDGNDKSLTGKCVLARSNNVPGSAEKARRWHLHSCDLS